MPGQGKYIVLEGGDLSGKSTQSALLVDRLNSEGVSTVKVWEPGTTPMGEEIRTVLKSSVERDAGSNLWLFSAARHDLAALIINPELTAGKFVVSDRSWVSTLAYQGYGEGVDIGTIQQLTRRAIGSLMRPDCLIFVDVSEEERQVRAIARGDDPDYFERKGPEFQQKVREGFLKTVTNLGGVAIDGEGSIEEVQDRVWQHVETLIRSSDGV